MMLFSEFLEFGDDLIDRGLVFRRDPEIVLATLAPPLGSDLHAALELSSCGQPQLLTP
jgi:hypothetical protein